MSGFDFGNVRVCVYMDHDGHIEVFIGSEVGQDVLNVWIRDPELTFMKADSAKSDFYPCKPAGFKRVWERSDADQAEWDFWQAEWSKNAEETP